MGIEFTEEATIEELLQDLTILANRLSNKILGDAPVEIPDNTQEIAVKYYHAHDLYGTVDNIFASVRHTREILRVAMCAAMEMLGEKSVGGPEGSTVTRTATIYAKVEDKSAFIDWCRKNGLDEFLEVKPRKGTKNSPGIDHVVRDAVNLARSRGGDILLPPGLGYTEKQNLRVTRPSEAVSFDNASKSIIDRLKEGL